MAFTSFIAAGVTLFAPNFSEEYLGVGFFSWLTNSILVAALVTGIIVILARRATANMRLVPGGEQNLFEGLVEVLYNLLEGIVGRHMISKTFSFLASLFIFILISNWFGLLPGVGSIGWGHGNGWLSVEHADVPLLRPATADLNLTLGLAALAMILWLYWTLQEVGVVGFIKHIFAPKGGMTGWIGKCLVPMFFFVGILEIISIATRPISLSLRLFGNIYAGENILSMMISIGKDFGFSPILTFLTGIIVPIPFYFLELGVGVLQAFVFMLLCAVYIQLSTSHEDESH
jgi:F-type H+-transporting ATPase subunit a